MQHAYAQLVTQPVHHAVVRAHALLHNFRRYSDHVRVANLPPLHHPHDGHSGAQFSGLRRHAQNTHIGVFERFEHRLRRILDRPRPKIFQQ